MHSLLARRLRLVLLAAATVLLLSGCVKLDVDLTVGDDDTYLLVGVPLTALRAA